MILALLAVVISLPVAGILLRERSWQRSAAMVAVLVLAFGLVFIDQWDSSQVESLRDSPGLIALGIGGAVAVCLALAVAIRRWPILFPALVVATLPFRVPIEVGGEEANLLIPLYLVIGAGALASLDRQLRSPSRSAGHTGLGGVAGWLRPLLAVSVVLFALAILYSADRSQGIQNLSFFLVPFAVLFALLGEVRWDRRTLMVALGVLLVQAFICALIGFVEYQTRQLLWNEVVIRSNEFHVYFRVNSLFWDPNLYGRFLALVIIAVVAVIAWLGNRRTALWLSAVALVLWLALFTTFSQSSFLALIAGIAAVIALRWNLRAVLAGLAAAAVAGIAFLAVGGEVVKLDFDRINPQTGGRADLVSGGLELFTDRPVAGYGAGSFALAFREEVAGPDAPVAESHTEPVTVAAETGIVGLLVYLALIASSLAVLLSGARSQMPGLGQVDGNAPAGRSLAAMR